MFIEERFQQDNVNCYNVVDDSGIKISYTFRGLYDKEVLEGLIASGYKVLDYHGHILTPDGISIEDIALSDNTLNENEVHMMKEMDVFALSEAEASEYFSRDIVKSVVELKQPDITINTREELINYLNNYRELSKAGKADSDCLPLNSFVNPEALFTLEELQTDSMVQYYMQIIESRRCLKNFKSLKMLIKFLQDKGVLAEHYSADDVKSAYLSWGICGVKTMPTQIKDIKGVTGNIFYNDTTTSNEYNTECYGLMDKQGRITVLSGVYDIAEEEDFNLLETRPVDEDGYYKLLHSVNKWNSSYRAVKCMEAKCRTRTLMTLLDDSGVTYKAKIDNNAIFITTARGNVLVQKYLKMQVYSGMLVDLDIPLANKDDDFRNWNLCCAKAHDLIRCKTLKSDVDSSYELLSKEGLHKKSIIDYMARRIEEDRTLNSGFDADIPLGNASDFYNGKIPKEYITKYNPHGMEYSNIDELIDIMINTRDDLIDRNEYLLVDETNAITKARSKEERELRVIEQLEFAKDVLDGEVNIDNLARGKRTDGTVDYTALTNFLILCYKKFGNGKDIIDYLAHIQESSDDVDFNEVFTTRDKAYWGAVEDTARLNELRAKEAVSAIYITRVFREAANNPVEDQRHYAFECLALDLSSKKNNSMVIVQNQIADMIGDIVENMPLSYFLKKSIIIEKANIALDLIFRIKFNNIEQEFDGDKTVFTIKHIIRTEKVEFKVAVPNVLVSEIKKPDYWRLCYCKLSDWCLFDVADGYIKLYCLNANINPWYVEPKVGFNINSYNFAINYLSEESFQRINEDLRNKTMEVNGKVAVLKDISGNMLVPDNIVNNAVTYDLENVEEYLQNKVFLETFNQYFTRFSILNKKAISEGKMLYRMRSKSDVLFNNYSNRDTTMYMSTTDDEYVDAVDADSTKGWTRSVDVLALNKNSDKFAIEAGHNEVSTFDINNESFSDVIKWPELLSDEFVPNAIQSVFGSKCVYVTQADSGSLDLKSLAMEELEDLEKRGMVYRLNARTFLIKAVNGMFKVEVR